MEQNTYIIFIDSTQGPIPYYPTRWQMNIDLQYVCEHAGKREYWYDENYKKHQYVPFTMAHAKKILRLLYIYTSRDKDQQEDIKNFLTLYPKMLKIWEKLP